MTSRICSVTAAVVLAGALSSCSVGLDRLPLPAPSAGARTYPITATFANALNLPTKAKVRLSGADVGEVESMTARDYTAVVTMRISSDTQIPVGTTAELRSATPLGDIFVSLKPPADADPGGPLMAPGDAIPAHATATAASVEQVLTTASLLSNGGAIRNVINVVNGMGHAVGGKGEDLKQFLDESTRIVQNLSDRSTAIKTVLAQSGELSTTLSDRQQTIDEAIEASAPALGTLAGNTDHVVDLAATINRITLQLAKFPSVRGEISRSMIADLNRLSAGLDAATNAPDASLENFSRVFGPMLKLTNSTSSHVDIDLADMAVGAFADLHHPGDPGSHGPTREDFRNMVGSISYALIKVRDKFWGAPTMPPGLVPPPDLIGPRPGELTPAQPRPNLLAPGVSTPPAGSP
ncbi:mammalian cell entry protein [Mycolicibacter engbaekii]|uniref:Mammalian cell entry protein n=1 Tax=Mycolicibacter engbaekii TaxID=188915 RepID=A0A1X1TWP8_9MYCO|nr:MCE family protein [Mycolicibacter engbaekii]ORV48977.1 mammalian cell entry protein [Mycolicibacter engbaekii]